MVRAVYYGVMTLILQYYIITHYVNPRTPLGRRHQHLPHVCLGRLTALEVFAALLFTHEALILPQPVVLPRRKKRW